MPPGLLHALLQSSCGYRSWALVIPKRGWGSSTFARSPNWSIAVATIRLREHVGFVHESCGCRYRVPIVAPTDETLVSVGRDLVVVTHVAAPARVDYREGH